MKIQLISRKWGRFALQIVFPVILAGALFILAIFEVLIPAMERQLMERKKDTIRELTLAAWSILDSYHQQEAAGALSRSEAQQEAAARIQSLRYGEDGKDYFWITDTHPTMVMHPYRSDLNGQDLSTFEDTSGKRMFVAFVQAAQAGADPYVDYLWQWKDDPTQIVQKLSYVKAFEPWGWVIGTGIYIEDVQQEIHRIERSLTLVSVGISGLMVFILFFILRGSLVLERQRTRAEEELRESHERYRMLVESANEGTLMVLDGRCAFANRALLDRLGYESGELSEIQVTALVAAETRLDRQAKERLELLLAGEAAPPQFEARLRRKDGGLIEALLTATRVSFAGQEGFILVARDLGLPGGETLLGETGALANKLTRAIPLAVFRSTWGKKTRLLEANPAMRSLFGLELETDLDHLDWLAQVTSPEERTGLADLLNTQQVARDVQVDMTAAGGRVVRVSCFALLSHAEGGQVVCDGVLQDLSGRLQAEAERDALIAQLQASQFSLQEPVSAVMSTPVTCDMNLPVRQAAQRMSAAGASAIVVCGPTGEPLGIVTDHDCRARVLAAGLDTGRPVFEIVSAPLQAVSTHALVYEAVLQMQEKDVSCLAVKDDAGRLQGIVRHIDLVRYRQHSAMILLLSIRRANSVDAVREACEHLPALVNSLVQSGVRVRQINRMISSVADAVTERLLGLAVEQLGPPPARYAFLSLGSEGREEQTLLTDQDNALLYEDPSAEQAAVVQAYFLALGEQVCDWLDQMGYAYCQGGIMAKNPQWNLPLSGWEMSFQRWIHNANPQELLELNMAFDFRCVSGDAALAHTLRNRVFTEMNAYPPFFLHFAQNALLYKPPLGMFGNILVESAAGGSKALNLKEAMLPVVNYARLYALRHAIVETHTADRLARLHEQGLLSRDLYEDLLPAYEALMRMRLDRQSAALLAHRRPNNLIGPQEWTPLEEAMLKRAFSILGSLRKKISYDFLGMA